MNCSPSCLNNRLCAAIKKDGWLTRIDAEQLNNQTQLSQNNYLSKVNHIREKSLNATKFIKKVITLTEEKKRVKR